LNTIIDLLVEEPIRGSVQCRVKPVLDKESEWAYNQYSIVKTMLETVLVTL
jgi:hypothetical protein